VAANVLKTMPDEQPQLPEVDKISQVALSIAVLAVARELGARISLSSEGVTIPVSPDALHDLAKRPNALASARAVETVLFLADGNAKRASGDVTSAMVRILFRAQHALDKLTPGGGR
jgi:hypothetical protein